MADERVIIEIELDDGSIRKGFATINREGEKAGKRAGDNLEKGIKRGGESAAASIRRTFLGLAATLGGINLFRGAVQSAIQTEQISTQLKILTGTAKTAAGVLSELQEFSAGTPFRFPDIADSANKLLAFEFQASEVRDRIEEIGEVAAGSNSSIREIALIYGQVAAAGKLTGERLLQLQERAVPIGPAIQKALGGATESVKELVSAGKVTLPVFQEAFRSLSQEGGLFAGALAAQSQTVGGILSTLSDNVFLAQTAFGNLFSPIIIKASKTLITGLQNLTKAIQDNSDEIQTSLLFTLNQLGAAFGTARRGIKLFADEIITITTVIVAFKTAAVITAQLSTLQNAFGLARFAIRQTIVSTKAQIIEFNRLRATYGIVAAASLTFAGTLRGLKAAFSVARIAAVTFQATLSLGLSLLLTEIITFVIETKEAFGGWANLLQTVGLNAKLIFLQVAQAVVTSVNTIIERLSVFNNLPFGLGDKFAAFSGKLIETSNGIQDSIKQTTVDLANLSIEIEKSAQAAANANGKLTKSGNDATNSAKERLQVERDLLNLRSQLGGIENELIVLEAQEQQKIAIIKAAQDQKLLDEMQFQELKRQILAQSEADEQQIRDDAALKQEASFNNFGEKFSNALKAQARASKVTFGEIARTAQSVLARGVGSAFTKVGQALASGQNAFDAFKDALKNVLGDIASATGDLFIKQGIGYLFLNPGIGAGLIAAGAALKVLGGFLGSGGGGVGATTGGAGGGATTFQTETDPTIAAADEEREGPQVVFQTTIQGDVLDSSDTRRRLVNLFQEGAEEEGIELNQGVFA